MSISFKLQIIISFHFHSWIYVANPNHRQKLETETAVVEDEDNVGITYYTIVKDERGEKRFLEKHPDRNIKIVKRNDLKKLPLDKRFLYLHFIQESRHTTCIWDFFMTP